LYKINIGFEVNIMKKVLLLSASTGGGHNSAAKAIKDSLEKLDCEVSVVDTLKFVSPVLDKIVSSGYEKSAKYVPKTYGAIYKISSGKINKEELDVFVRRVLGRKILRLIEDTKPDAIIGTHPFPVMALMKFKEQGTLDIPVISILTDYSIHPAHVQKYIDAYIAGDEDIGYLLRNAGVEKEKIYPLGIPISSNFLSTDRVSIVKSQLGLEDKFTVLLMGGSFGAGNMKDCFLDLIKSKYNFQIVVVTGRDVSLKDKLQRLADDIKTDKNVKILGFTKDMPELLTIADVLVSKPGGLTTTEAIIKQIPLVIPYLITALH
jgi:processive 1,2-diacylglycerol beta-glucosyltransferase